MAKHPLMEKNVRQGFVHRCQLLVKYWQRKAEASLKHRQKMLAARASGFYNAGYSRQHTINLIDRGVSTVVPYLVEGNPRILVTTPVSNYRGWAYTTQLAINYFIEKIKFAERVLIPMVRNSMFGAGITKTITQHNSNFIYEDVAYRLGIPTVEIIDDSNYIGDSSATRREDFMIEGDIYRLPTEYAKEFFDRKLSGGRNVADYIKADSKLLDRYDPKEISSPNFDIGKLGLRDYSTFIDLYIYDEGTIVTIMPDGKAAIKIREEDYDGPEGGPYDYLAYNFFPDEPIPIPPAWSWMDMDITTNILIDKMKAQAENQKDILAYEAGAEKDVERVAKSSNLSTVRVDDLDKIKAVSYGGVNPLNYQWVSYIENQFTKQGGNADVIGGRGVQAPTLGQEQMIMANATRIINNMYNRFVSVMMSQINKLAWHFWTNPTTFVPVVKEIPGVGSLPAFFSNADKVGDFYDFIFKIMPYSTSRENPQTKHQKMVQFLSQWVLPTMQLASAQGAEVDIPLATRILADYIGLEEFNQIYKTAIPHELEAVPYQMQPFGLAETKRKTPGKKKSTGQLNDSMGANEISREANMLQQQTRAGGQPSPEHTPGERGM